MTGRIRVLTLGDMGEDEQTALRAQFELVAATEASAVGRDEAVRGIVTRGRTMPV